MNNTLGGAELVEQWRNNAELDNPAGSLFTGEFAEAEIADRWVAACSACVTCVGHICL
jgi:hypothetical protein